MRGNFGLILKKELTDIVRDKRSFIMLFVPVILFPAMFLLMGSQIEKNGQEKQFTYVAYCDTQEDRALYDQIFGALDSDESARIQRLDIPYDQAEEALRRGDALAMLEFQSGVLTYTSSASSTANQAIADEIYKMIEQINQAVAEQTLQQQGIDFGALRPMRMQKAASVGTGSSAMAIIAPMLLVMLIMNGGVSVAVDLFTGEKERGTFESLLTTQTSRMSILAAKFASTLCVSVASMTLSILAYLISFSLSDSTAMMLGGGEQNGADLGLGFGQIVGILAVCLSLSVFSASLLTLLALHARTVKEAQSQTSLLTVFASLLGGAVAFKELSGVSNLSMLIPVYNVIMTIKMLFADMAQGTQVAVTIVSCLVYSAALLMLSTRLLKSEKMLRG